jgi:hypothetical protein
VTTGKLKPFAAKLEKYPTPTVTSRSTATSIRQPLNENKENWDPLRQKYSTTHSESQRYIVRRTGKSDDHDHKRKHNIYARPASYMPLSDITSAFQQSSNRGEIVTSSRVVGLGWGGQVSTHLNIPNFFIHAGSLLSYFDCYCLSSYGL